ncbi:cytochrome P450 [Noviherbaspirillum sp. ST9]|uniref:cytochrome P450 n=1 Tax=Noviherbaspirillum sp. ST9 TaxID=3401606 RepID=UPI003B588020
MEPSPKPFPRDSSPDATLALLREGYGFISNRCRRLRSDVFETRLMLSRVTCAMGEDAAEMFYHPGRFTRKQALPPTALMLLQDVGSAQVLDGDAHRHRKRMLMSLVDEDRVRDLVANFEDAWQARIPAWTAMEQVVLHTEVEQLLCAAVCQWAGVPLTPAAVEQRAGEFAAMIDGAGAIGPRNWRGLLLRVRTEEWARSIIEGVRAQHIGVPEGSPAHMIAMHREPDGSLLDSQSAAVELINLLRPTVAVARYMTFSALALHRFPECRDTIRGNGADWLECFVQEVRRFYPFFPSVGGRARHAFDWRGTHFPAGTWVLLYLYGTNHDQRIWGDPEVFRPERFRNWNRNAYRFVPQGGGEAATGHRCPGERLTVALAMTAARLLATGMDYDVPDQDLRIDMARIPAIPKSRFVIANVTRTGAFDQESRVLRGREPHMH